MVICKYCCLALSTKYVEYVVFDVRVNPIRKFKYQLIMNDYIVSFIYFPYTIHILLKYKPYL